MFQIGDEVLAPWANDGFIYPAILVDKVGNTAHVAYFDGDEADVPVESLRQGVLGPGLAVNVNWKGQRRYFSGVIRQRLSQAVFVDYEDGDKGWATIAQCRVRAEVLQALAPTTLVCSWCGASMLVTERSCPACKAPRRLS